MTIDNRTLSTEMDNNTASQPRHITCNTDELVRDNPITLTALVADHIKSYVAKARDKGAIAMRLAVDKGGCSGKKYRFELTDTIDPKVDLVFTQHGAQVVINQHDFTSFAGLEIDLESTGLNKYVVFRNPNAKHTCGCGKSFG